MYNNLRTIESGMDLTRLDSCMEYVHIRVCKERRKDHPAIRCRFVESMQGASGLRVLRWLEKHPRDVAYPELLLHSAVCWFESCDMKKHAKQTQGPIVREMRKWLKANSEFK